MKEVRIFTGAWNGDREIGLAFPDAWDVQVVGRSPGPALSVDAMRARMRAPIGTPRLAELARGRKLIVIPGEEVKTDGQGEVIGLFLREEIPRGLSFGDTIAAIRAQDGLVATQCGSGSASGASSV